MYVSKNITEVGVASAVLEFNIGAQRIRKIYKNCFMFW